MRSYQVDRWQMARWAAVLTVAGMVVCLVLYPSQKKSEAQLHEQGLWRSPKLAVDAYVVRRVGGGEFQVLLIQRSREPHKGSWALPGGFVAWMEDPPAAVAREVAEETQLVVDQQEPPVFVNFRGSPKRDPRTHTVSAGYACKVTAESLQRMQRGDDAGAVDWFPLEAAAQGKHPRMAFDHVGMLEEFAAWFAAAGRQRGLFVDAPG